MIVAGVLPPATSSLPGQMGMYNGGGGGCISSVQVEITSLNITFIGIGPVYWRPFCCEFVSFKRQLKSWVGKDFTFQTSVPHSLSWVPMAVIQFCVPIACKLKGRDCPLHNGMRLKENLPVGSIWIPITMERGKVSCEAMALIPFYNFNYWTSLHFQSIIIKYLCNPSFPCRSLKKNPKLQNALNLRPSPLPPNPTSRS